MKKQKVARNGPARSEGKEGKWAANMPDIVRSDALGRSS